MNRLTIWGARIMKRFVEGADRGQSTMLPECLDDWIDESNDLSRDDRKRTRRQRASNLPVTSAVDQDDLY
jgi:hypothetical protein